MLGLSNHFITGYKSPIQYSQGYGDGLKLILRLSKYDVPFSEGKCLSKKSHTIDGKGVKRIVKERFSLNFDPCRENELIIEVIQNTVKRKHKRIFG